MEFTGHARMLLCIEAIFNAGCFVRAVASGLGEGFVEVRNGQACPCGSSLHPSVGFLGQPARQDHQVVCGS